MALSLDARINDSDSIGTLENDGEGMLDSVSEGLVGNARVGNVGVGVVGNERLVGVVESGGEESLVDEDEAGFTGTLSFKTSDSCSQLMVNTEEGPPSALLMPDPITRSRTGRPGPVSVCFDIGDARIETTEHGKFVVYTIQISRAGSVDDSVPAKICRRYSEFDKLNSSLNKLHKQSMKGIQFPVKRISGNFTSETIARRSRAFEQYLSHLFSVPSLRQSVPFTDFLYGSDLRDGHLMVSSGQYERALCVLLHAWKVQEKVVGDVNLDVVRTLCAAIACYCAMDKLDVAHAYAQLALDCVPGSDDIATAGACPYLLPLIKVTVWLSWKLNREKRALEERLRGLRVRGGFDVDGAPTLLELVVSRYKTTT